MEIQMVTKAQINKMCEGDKGSRGLRLLRFLQADHTSLGMLYSLVKEDRYCEEYTIWMATQPEFAEYLAKTRTDIPKRWLLRSLGNAAESSDIDAVRILLECGVRAVNSNDQVIQSAAQGGNVEIAKMVLDHGFDINQNHGNALHLAAMNGHYDMVKFLLDRNITNGSYDTAISKASWSKDIRIVKLLIARGVNSAICMGSALESAACNGCLEIAKLAIENGADVNKDHWSPLVKASEYGYVEIIELLFENNVDIGVYGAKALEMAIKNRRVAVGKLLCKKIVEHLDTVEENTGEVEEN